MLTKTMCRKMYQSVDVRLFAVTSQYKTIDVWQDFVIASTEMNVNQLI